MVSNRGSPVVIVRISWPACHEFDPSTIENPSGRGGRCTLNLSRLNVLPLCDVNITLPLIRSSWRVVSKGTQIFSEKLGIPNYKQTGNSGKTALLFSVSCPCLGLGLPTSFISTKLVKKRTQGHNATLLRVKEDIEDISSELLSNGGERLHFLDETSRTLLLSASKDIIKPVQDL
ncbi:hypothetical protein TNCV_1673791 [Trichonephila clavipes]|nr:hypothetical protein TNCV_1673791 [Trichonephila clavipes]